MSADNLTCVFKWSKEAKHVNLYRNYCRIPEPVNSELNDDIFGIKMDKQKTRRLTFEHDRNSTSDSDFIDNYANLLAAVQINRVTVVVERGNDKISLKVFNTQKWRDVGRPYFRKSQRIYFLTYNTRTNDLFYGRTVNGPTKRHRVHEIKRNYFSSRPASVVLRVIIEYVKSLKCDEEEAKKVSHDAMVSMLNDIPNLELTPNTPDFILFKHYIRTRNIKAPDNLTAFQDLIPIPKPRVIKKYQNKWVEAVMATHDLRGGKILHVLHSVNRINLRLFNTIKNFFGEKFIIHQDADNIRAIFESVADIGFPNVSFTDKERSNAFSVLMSIIKSDSGNSLMTFIDHMNFYARLSIFEKITWKSMDYSSFESEHLDWTERLNSYLVGHITREYDSRLTTILEAPIIIGQMVHYPVILKTTDEYNNESATQNNCVKTYVKHSTSFIVSLRAEEVDAKDRLTVEIKPSITPNGEFKLRRSQTLGRFNKAPDLQWYPVIEVLDERIALLNETSAFTYPPRMTHTLKSGEFTYTLEVKNDGQLAWSQDCESEIMDFVDGHNFIFF